MADFISLGDWHLSVESGNVEASVQGDKFVLDYGNVPLGSDTAISFLLWGGGEVKEYYMGCPCNGTDKPTLKGSTYLLSTKVKTNSIGRKSFNKKLYVKTKGESINIRLVGTIV